MFDVIALRRTRRTNRVSVDLKADMANSALGFPEGRGHQALTPKSNQPSRRLTHVLV